MARSVTTAEHNDPDRFDWQAILAMMRGWQPSDIDRLFAEEDLEHAYHLGQQEMVDAYRARRKAGLE